MVGGLCAAVLVLVCGLPAAGKTTLVKHLEASGSTPSRIYERISFDDLYEGMVVDDAGASATEFDPEQWKACQQVMETRVSNRLKLHNASAARSKGTKQQLVLLADDNFQYQSLRKRFFHLVTELNCGFALLYVNAPAAICRERNACRSEGGKGGVRVPTEVFERMAAAFEAPNGHQNLWEVNTFELKDKAGSNSNIGEVMDILIKQSDRELEERYLLQMDRLKVEAQQHRDRLATQQNVLHLVDLQLRQWISTQLRNESVILPGITKSQLASQLNQRRKNYLMSMKLSTSDIADRCQGQPIEQVVVSLVRRFQQPE